MSELRSGKQSSGAGPHTPSAGFPPDDIPKLTVPDYELIKRIGRGSYGEVWLGKNATGSYHAIKAVYRSTFESDKPYEREFTGIREFEPISRSHPAQIDILHVGRNDKAGYFYYVMELADDESAESETLEARTQQLITKRTCVSQKQVSTGTSIRGVIHPESYAPKTLRSVLQDDRRIPVRDCLNIALALADALEHLHSHGLVHRDIKPSNVIFVNGRPKLADIGLVARIDATISIVGTEGYLPPEGPGKSQADIYSLGKVFYEMATGKDRNEFPAPPAGIEETPDHRAFVEFNEIILQCCEPPAEKRYQSAADLLIELNLLRRGRSIRRLRTLEKRLAMVGRVAILVTVMAGVAVAGFLYQSQVTENERELREIAEQATGEADKARIAAESARVRTEHLLVERETALRQLELEKTNYLFESDRTGEAMAQLAQHLRENRNDSFAVRRLRSAMTDRNFALPLAEFQTGPGDRASRIAGADISPQGDKLVTLTVGGTLTLWDLSTGQTLDVEQAGEIEVRFDSPLLNVHFNRDGTRIVTPGVRDNAVVMWRVVEEGLELALEIARPGKQGEFRYAEFSPDGTRVAAIDLTGQGYVWDAETGEPLAAFGERQSEPIEAPVCQFTADGEALVLAFGTNPGRVPGSVDTPSIREISVWDSRTGTLLNSLDDDLFLGFRPVYRLDTFSLDPVGSRIVYRRVGRKIRVWDYLRDIEVSPDEEYTHEIRVVAYSPNGQLLATGWDDDAVRVWELDSDRLRLVHELPHEGSVISLAFSGDGECLASGSTQGTVRIWDVKTGKLAGEPIQQGSEPRHLEFTPDDKRLLAVSRQSAWVWDVRPGMARPNLIVPEVEPGALLGPVRSVRFSPDGNRLIGTSGHENTWKDQDSRDLSSHVWNPVSGDLLAPPIKTVNGQTRIAITPDFSHAVTALEDGFVLWDPMEGQEFFRQENIGYLPRLMALSPDGRWLLTSNREREVRKHEAAVWDLRSRTVVRSLSRDFSLLGAAFSPDSSRLFLVRSGVGGSPGAERGLVQTSETGETLFFVEISSIAAPSRYIDGEAHWGPDQMFLAFTFNTLLHFNDASNGQSLLVRPFEHQEPILDSRFSADGSYFLTASADKTVRISTVDAGLQTVWEFRQEDDVTAAVFSGDNRVVASGSMDGSARLWDMGTGLPFTEPLLHPEGVRTVALDPSGRWLATGSGDGAVRVWELPRAEAPVPDWFLELAGLLGGLKVNSSSVVEEVMDPTAILALKLRMNADPTDTEDEYVRWARWFFADREQRPVSPSAEVTMETYHRRLNQLENMPR